MNTQPRDTLDHVEPTDCYAGLPVRAVLEGGPFFSFDVPDEPVKLSADMIQMMDDMAAFGVQK